VCFLHISRVMLRKRELPLFVAISLIVLGEGGWSFSDGSNTSSRTQCCHRNNIRVNIILSS
jgi:hypothetical protein